MRQTKILKREVRGKSKAGTKERSLESLSLPNRNTILLNIKWYYFYKIWKKYNEIQLTKNKMDLNNLFLFINSVLRQVRQGCYLAAALTKQRVEIYVSTNTYISHHIHQTITTLHLSIPSIQTFKSFTN